MRMWYVHAHDSKRQEPAICVLIRQLLGPPDNNLQQASLSLSISLLCLSIILSSIYDIHLFRTLPTSVTTLIFIITDSFASLQFFSQKLEAVSSNFCAQNPTHFSFVRPLTR
jgi:hypothetical protein